MDYLEYEYEDFEPHFPVEQLEIPEYRGTDVLFWSIVSFTGGVVAASLWFTLVMYCI